MTGVRVARGIGRLTGLHTVTQLLETMELGDLHQDRQSCAK